MSEEMKVKKYTPPSTFDGTKFPPVARRQIKQRTHKTPIVRAVEHHEQVIKPKIQEIERQFKYKIPKTDTENKAVISLITRIIRTYDNIGKIIKANPLKLLKTIMVR